MPVKEGMREGAAGAGRSLVMSGDHGHLAWGVGCAFPSSIHHFPPTAQDLESLGVRGRNLR